VSGRDARSEDGDAARTQQPRRRVSKPRRLPVYLKLMFSVQSLQGSMALARKVLALGATSLRARAVCT
jgi:hypothetical protein